MWPALDSSVRLPTSLTRPRPFTSVSSRRARGLMGDGSPYRYPSVKPETSCHPSAPHLSDRIRSDASRLRWLSSGSPRLPHTCVASACQGQWLFWEAGLPQSLRRQWNAIRWPLCRLMNPRSRGRHRRRFQALLKRRWMLQCYAALSRNVGTH